MKEDTSRTGDLNNLNSDDKSGMFVEGQQSTQLSGLFELDRTREKAATDPSLQEFDPEATVDREAVRNEEKAIPLYANPFVKGGFVFGGIGLLIAAAAWVFTQSTSISKPVAVKQETKEEFKNPVVGDSQLKGQLALDKQNAMLAAQKEQPTTKPTATPAPTPAVKPVEPPTPTAQVKPTPQPTPAPQTYKPTPPIARATPTPLPYNPPVTRSYPIARAVKIPSYAPKPTPKPQIVALKTPAPAPRQLAPAIPLQRSSPSIDRYGNGNGQQEWQQQATEGTFGGRFQRGSQQVAQAPAPTLEIANAYLPSESEIYDAPREPKKAVLVGAKSLGILLTPVQVATGDKKEHLITVGLNQPILDRTGRIAIPGGSQIQFKVVIADNGWLEATSTKVFIDGQSSDVTGIFSLTLDNGKPLVAESLKFGEDVIGQNDKKNFILGALQKVGSVLTEPTTQSSITSSTTSGVTSSTSSQSNPNIIGAIFNGGFTPLAASQITRSNSDINRLLNASKLWFLPTGTNIKIVSVQPLSI
jgi:hypothetical protein